MPSLAQRCHYNVSASKHVVVELAPRTTDQSFLQKLLVAADDGRDMPPYFQPITVQYRNIATGGADDQVGIGRCFPRVVYRNDFGVHDETA